MKERIQKFLSRQGVASRRQIESLIRQGRIEINGLQAVLGVLISIEDQIKIDGKETLPFLSILFTNCDTNNSIFFNHSEKQLFGLAWDYMGVNGYTRLITECSINVHGKDGA